MDNPQIVPVDYLEQPPNSPSSDNPENLRPSSPNPYTIPSVPAEGVNITVRLSPDGRPVPLAQVEIKNPDNVKEINVFVFDEPSGEYVPVTPSNVPGVSIMLVTCCQHQNKPHLSLNFYQKFPILGIIY